MLARHGSFTAAARELGVSSSALSQTVRALEERLQVRLFNRSTRRVNPTEHGERFLQQIAPALAQIQAAFVDLEQIRERPAGKLRLNSSNLANLLVIAPRLAIFLQRYPDIEVDISTEDALSDVVGGGFDAGFRLGEFLDQDMVAVPVGVPQSLWVVGSPGYLAMHGTPVTPTDLAEHECLRFRRPGSKRVMPWFFNIDGRDVEMPVRGRLIANDGYTLRQATRDGLGLAMQFAGTVAEDLRAGRLLQVLGDFAAQPEQLYIYYPARQHLPRKLRVFIDFLREWDAAEGG